MTGGTGHGARGAALTSSTPQLDDLSSDSDDEYFDVVQLPGLRPPLPPPSSSAASSRPEPQKKLLSSLLNPPAHSRSLPAVNKGPQKRAAMGNNPAHIAASAYVPDTSSAPPTHGEDKSPTATPQAAAVPTPNATPPPPHPSATPPSVAPSKVADRSAPQTHAGSVAARGGAAACKGDTLKKYQAPQPPKDIKDTKDLNDVNNSKDENKHDQQEGDAGNQGDKQSKPDRPEANKQNKQQCDSPEKVSQNKVNSVEAPPRPNSTITPVTNGVAHSGSDAEQALGATPKPRRAPSFKKYPAPQPPATQGRPKSDGVTVSLSREHIMTASSGSVPSLLQSSVTGLNAAPSPSGTSGGEKKSPDTQSSFTGKMVQQEAAGGKQLSQTPTEGTPSPSPAPSTRKMRAGSPVPERVSGSGQKSAAAPLVTGKLKIATDDGAATVKQYSTLGDKVSLSIKVAGKEDNKSSGDISAAANKSPKIKGKGGEAALVEDKKIPNGDLTRSPSSSPENTLGKKTLGKVTKTTDTVSPSSTQQQDNTVKNNTPKATKTEIKPDHIIENHVTNGTHEAGEGKTPADDQSKYKKMNGVHHDEDKTNGSRDTRSRSNSVASDVTSSDVSQKSSGSKRSKTGKLAGIMNKFEVEEPPKSSDKVKPKTKVGKISGLASVFESGKDPASKSDLASLKSPEKKAPESKPVSIGGISTSKFGSVAKFKKPVDPKKEESKPLTPEETDKSTKESSAKKKDEVNGVTENTETQIKKASEKIDKSNKESSKKKDEVNGVTENTENDKQIKKASDKTNKSDKESTKKKDEVNGVTENTENDKQVKKTSEKIDKSNKESSKKKDEVNGVTENTDNDKQVKKISEKIDKSNKESSKKKDEVNGVIDHAENLKINKPTEKKETSNKESVLKKKDLVNGIIESCENDHETKKPPDKNNKQSSVKKKDYVNGVSEGVENGLETKTQLISKKTEKAIETTPLAKKKSYINGVTESADNDQKVKKTPKPENETKMQVKIKEKTETDSKKNNVVSEVPETLTNGDLLSDESSLSSACDIEEKDVTTPVLAAPVTPATAGRGGATPGTTSKGPAKLCPAKEEDTESKITLGWSDSAKATKDSGAVSKGTKGKVEGKTDGTEVPTVKGKEVLAASTEAAKIHAAKVDKSHSKFTKVEAEQEVTPAGGAAHLDVTKVKENHVPCNNGSIVAPKREDTLAAPNAIKKNNKESTGNMTVTPLVLKASNDSAADKAMVDVMVRDTKTAAGEVLAIATAAEASKASFKNTTTPYAPALQTNTSLSLEHKPEGERIEIRVIPKATIADQPLTKIKVIAKATVSDQQLTFTTAAADSSLDTNVCQSLPLFAGLEGRPVPNSSSAPQLSSLSASGYSWKTNRIRRKLDYAIENTANMLPRMESEVQDLLREASNYLGPERRARRSCTPTFPRSRSSCPQLAARRARSHGDDEDEVFEDALDPSQLDTLMPLPDVQAERERRSHSRTPMEGPERSLSNNSMVAQAESLLSETDRLLRRSRSDKSLRRSYSRSLSSAALNKVGPPSRPCPPVLTVVLGGVLIPYLLPFCLSCECHQPKHYMHAGNAPTVRRCSSRMSFPVRTSLRPASLGHPAHTSCMLQSAQELFEAKCHLVGREMVGVVGGPVTPLPTSNLHHPHPHPSLCCCLCSDWHVTLPPLGLTSLFILIMYSSFLPAVNFILFLNK